MPPDLSNPTFGHEPCQELPYPCPKFLSEQEGGPPAYDWCVLYITSSLVMSLTTAAKGLPCNEDSLYLPRGAPPPPADSTHDWAPFECKTSYKWAHLEFVWKRSSHNELNEALRLWSESGKERHGDDWAPFANTDDMYSTIDCIPYGACLWSSFEVRYTGDDANDAGAPSWKRAAYTVYTRDARETLLAQIGSTDFDGHFDYAPYREYEKQEDGKWARKLSNVMSGDWAWQMAVSQGYDSLAQATTDKNLYSRIKSLPIIPPRTRVWFPSLWVRTRQLHW
jgi:hypothetical protein